MPHVCVHLATFGPHGTCEWLAEDLWETRHRAPTDADLCGRIASHYIEVQCDEHGTILTHLCREHEAIASQDANWIRSEDLVRRVNRVLLDDVGFPSDVDLMITMSVWDDCVTWTDEDTERSGVHQDEIGRLWDVIWMTHIAHRGISPSDDRMSVCLHRWPSATSFLPEAMSAFDNPDDDDDDPGPPLVRLVARLERTTTRTRIVLDLPTGEKP